MMDWNAWFTWSVEHPTAAAVAAGSAALGVVLVIVLIRLAFAALGRRLLVGMGLRKKVERENPWASLDDRVTFKLRPARRPWWAIWRKA
jgi:hypothetical protein